MLHRAHAALRVPGPPYRPEQMAREKEQDDRQIVARNKRARHDYHILDSWEAGLVLTGTEVKSLRDGKATMADAYALVKERESCCFTGRRSAG